MGKTVRKPDSDGYKRMTLGNFQTEQEAYCKDTITVRNSRVAIAIYEEYTDGKVIINIIPSIDNGYTLKIHPTIKMQDTWKIIFKDGKFVPRNDVINLIPSHLDKAIGDESVRDIVKQEIEKLKCISME